MKKSKVQVYKSEKPGRGKGLWRWRAIAKNGKILAESSEAYTSQVKAIAGVEATFSVLMAYLDEESDEPTI